MGNQPRSNSRSFSSSSPDTAPDRISSGGAPAGVPRDVASRRLSGSRTLRPDASSYSFRQLGRPLREGERQLLTLLAAECVDSILKLGMEASQMTPSPIEPNEGEDGNL